MTDNEFNKDEELRYNNRNWVRIFKTRQENGYENTFEIQVEEKKDFSLIKEGKAISSNIVVYKYFLKPDAVTSKSADKEIAYLISKNINKGFYIRDINPIP